MWYVSAVNLMRSLGVRVMPTCCLAGMCISCRVGYLEQEPQLDAGDTVAENIAPAVQNIK
jgi:hypothetical protein